MDRSVSAPVHPAVPPLGAVLLAVACLLETAALAVRLLDVRGPIAGLLAMDRTGSLPHMFVVAVLAAAAVVAASGAAVRPARRGWWSGVASVAGLLAAAKAGGGLRSGLGGQAGSAVVLVALVVGGLLLMWQLSGHRRWVVGALVGHASAAVGLAAAAGYARVTGGPAPAAFATFVEESGEALTASVLLVAVLVGVLRQLAGAPARREEWRGRSAVASSLSRI